MCGFCWKVSTETRIARVQCWKLLVLRLNDQCCENKKREVGIVEAVLQETRIDGAGFTDSINRLNNVFRRLLGCWHRNMSLPFTRGSDTYCTCVDCGARRRFDLEQWRMVGDFYR